MSIITNYLSHLDGIKSKISDFAQEAVLENRGKIVNLVRYGQLAKGVNSDGSSLSNNKGYARSTQSYADRDRVQLPKTEGQEYNFQWSSQTFDNMYLDFIDTNNFTYEIETIKAKQNLLEGIYGEIFDLTDEHNELVNKTIIEPYVSTKIIQELVKF